MGFFEGIGRSLSDGIAATGEAARSVGRGVADGAGVVWEGTANATATGATLLGTTAPAYVNLGTDARMLPQWGTVEGYTSKGTCEQVERQIKVKLPFFRGAQRASAAATAQTGEQTTLQTPAESFLYLDVGRWGGSRSEAKRDFGIVCGRTAAVCAFTQGSGGRYGSFPDAVARLEGTPSDEIGPINALLGLLGSSPLGAPQVRRYMTSRTALPPGVTTLSQRVYVIVGDMHLPVVTGVAPGGTQPPEQQELRGRRMGRTRRTDMFKDLGTMSDSDASLWHERYVNGEIFEQAGPDLTSFVNMLTRARGNIGAELWLMQLGDMFDLWLGFDRFFAPDPPRRTERWGNDGHVLLQDMTEVPPPPAEVGLGEGFGVPLQDITPRAVATAEEFIETWIDRTLNHTTQGEHARNFLEFAPNASKFLYGNHDNYLGAHTPSELRGMRSKEHHDPETLLYACHGHQWDKYNRDGAVAGLATTQTAFWGGQIVRSWETDDRPACFLGAVDLFRSGQKPFCVFAMGHTHTAILTEVVIEIEPMPQYEPGPGTD